MYCSLIACWSHVHISLLLELEVNNYSNEIYEDPDRTYETLKDDEPATNEPGPSFGEYIYPGSDIKTVALTEDEYTYAKPDGNHEEENSNGAVYNTLEQPEQPTDEFYNTSAAQLPSSELEYDYALDTPGATSSDAKSTISDDLYHTLEEEGTALPEQEYTYAKNTEVPTMPNGVPQKVNTIPSVSENSGSHRTAELNHPHVYSTLEE